MTQYDSKRFVCKKVFLVMLAFFVHAVYSDQSKIQEDLFSSPEHKRDVIVTFGTIDEMKGIVEQITSHYSYSSKEERIYAMYQAMSSYSTKCQSSAQSYLDSASYKYHDMWSSNTMIIRNADHACAKALAEMSDVTAIREDATFSLNDPVVPVESGRVVPENGPGSFSIGITWGLNVMRVPEAWQYGDHGYGKSLKTGRGIVVSSIDTGVNVNHVKLHENFRGHAAWFDGYNLSDSPKDVNGHGTHTMGTICGQDGIGVAPGAQWITCRGCINKKCLQSALLKCCQWILCPHDMNQTEPENYRDCSTAPDVLSNSWGGGRGDKAFERCALALHAAQIIPIWAIGNKGPKCNTATSPGDLENVIAVGATNQNDELSRFSGRGPSKDGLIKPDVSAPGQNITSSWFNSSHSFHTLSGTSMATPHVAGLVALMLERCRLPYKKIRNILQLTADRERLGKTSIVCGDTKSDTFKNNFYGYGRVNALNAIRKVVQICHLDQNYNNYDDVPYQPGGTSGYNEYNSNNAHHPFWYGVPPNGNNNIGSHYSSGHYKKNNGQYYYN